MTRFARSCGAARSLRSRSVQLAAPVVEPRSGLLIPPQMCNMRKKKPVLAYELYLKYGGEGGIDSLCSPLRGSPFAALPVCPAGCASSRTPVGASHPPVDVQHAKKKPVLSYELFLKYGGEGGLTRFARPFGAARSRCSRSVQLAAPAVEPRSGLLIPPLVCNMRKKSPYFRTSSS